MSVNNAGSAESVMSYELEMKSQTRTTAKGKGASYTTAKGVREKKNISDRNYYSKAYGKEINTAIGK